ncbi:MAG: hypothetical protein PVG66_09215 [Chromatiales bacterium]|jgi:hypothetical protein
MARPHLHILGLGRCIIGNLKKSLQASDDVQLDGFTHQYLLNYRSLLDSPNVDTQQIQKLDQCDVAPTFMDQVQFSAAPQDGFDLILVELFPPAPLYMQPGTGICCSVEDANEAFGKLGFALEPSSAQQRNSQFPQVLQGLIKLLQQAYPQVPLAFVNGEYYDTEKNIGNSQLPELLMAAAKTIEASENCHLVNMKTLIDELAAKGMAFADSEFPLAYIRHDPDLQPIAIARDCKHASPALRDVFAGYLLKRLGRISQQQYEQHCEQTFSIGPKEFSVRAQAFLAQGDSLDMDDARVMARCFLYARAFPQLLSLDWLSAHILEHLSRPLAADLLKRGIFCIRSIAAWQYENANEAVFEALLGKLEEIAHLPDKIQQEAVRPLILWIKNIVLSLNRKVLHANISTNLVIRYIDVVNLLSQQQILMQSALIQLSMTTANTVLETALPEEKRINES